MAVVDRWRAGNVIKGLDFDGLSAEEARAWPARDDLCPRATPRPATPADQPPVPALAASDQPPLIRRKFPDPWRQARGSRKHPCATSTRHWQLSQRAAHATPR